MEFYHSVRMPDGSVNAGAVPVNAWQVVGLPDSLEGMDVLDIGCRDGYYAFEALRRGARSVRAEDVVAWPQFDWYKKELGLDVQFRQRSVYDLDEVATCDFVIFSQVLYHLEHPLLALQNIARATRAFVWIETVCHPSAECALFVANDTPDNVWYPTESCLRWMFGRVGLKPVRWKIWPGRIAYLLEK